MTRAVLDKKGLQAWAKTSCTSINCIKVSLQDPCMLQTKKQHARNQKYESPVLMSDFIPRNLATALSLIHHINQNPTTSMSGFLQPNHHSIPCNMGGPFIKHHYQCKSYPTDFWIAVVPLYPCYPVCRRNLSHKPSREWSSSVWARNQSCGWRRLLSFLLLDRTEPLFAAVILT